jgi:hypothetical protein
MMLSKEELIKAVHGIIDGDVADCSLDRLCRLTTVAQFVIDLCLNEIERRGELTYSRDDGRVIVPYQSKYVLPTILRGSSGELDTGHHQQPVVAVSVDDFELLVVQAFTFTARVLETMSDDRRPDAVIAKIAAALAGMPEDVLKLAETEVRSWQLALQHN